MQFQIFFIAKIVVTFQQVHVSKCFIYLYNTYSSGNSSQLVFTEEEEEDEENGDNYHRSKLINKGFEVNINNYPVLVRHYDFQLTKLNHRSTAEFLKLGPNWLKNGQCVRQ